MRCGDWRRLEARRRARKDNRKPVALINFDPFRNLGLPARHLHSGRWLEHRAALARADGVLFPEYWQVNALVHGLGARILKSAASYRLGHNKIGMARAVQAGLWRCSNGGLVLVRYTLNP